MADSQPSNFSDRFQDYVVYLASSETGDLRSQVESAVAAGTNQLLGQRKEMFYDSLWP